MTREEAIHFAECLKHNWTINFNDMKGFCDMAIDALIEYDMGFVPDIEPTDSADAEQVTGKLNKRDNSLLTDDSEECKEQKSKLDLISIQMAIEHWGRSSGNLTNDQIAELQREIESLPSAEPKTGKWIYLCGSIGSYMTISCPFCGVTFNDVAEWEYNFCPNCGADMRGKKSDD